MNQYRQHLLDTKKQWLKEHYRMLLDAGHVGAAIGKWIEKEGGVDGMRLDQLDSFGDLICRTLDKFPEVIAKVPHD